MMKVSLLPGQWDHLLLDALDTPPNLSVSYASDLRFLIQKRLEKAICALGFFVERKTPCYLSRSKAAITALEPYVDKTGEVHDANFCFRYGAEDASFNALNYSHDYQCLF